MRLPRMITVTLAGAAVLLPVAACSSSEEPAPGKAPQAATAAPSEEPTEAPEGHPFTGKPYDGLSRCSR